MREPKTPTLQQIPNLALIASQNHHIEVAVVANCSANEQFDGIPARDPPRSTELRQQQRRLPDGQWIPDI